MIIMQEPAQAFFDRTAKERCRRERLAHRLVAEASEIARILAECRLAPLSTAQGVGE